MKTKAIMIMSWNDVGSNISLRIIPSPDRARRTARPLDKDEWTRWRDISREVSDSMASPLLGVVCVPSNIDKQAINISFKGGTPLSRDEVESYIARFKLAFDVNKLPVEVDSHRLFDEAIRHNIWPDPVPPIGERDKIAVMMDEHGKVTAFLKAVDDERKVGAAVTAATVKKTATEAKDEPEPPTRPHPTAVIMAIQVLQEAGVSVLMGFEIGADSGLIIKPRYSQSFVIDNIMHPARKREAT